MVWGRVVWRCDGVSCGGRSQWAALPGHPLPTPPEFGMQREARILPAPIRQSRRPSRGLPSDQLPFFAAGCNPGDDVFLASSSSPGLFSFLFFWVLGGCLREVLHMIWIPKALIPNIVCVSLCWDQRVLLVTGVFVCFGWGS